MFPVLATPATASSEHFNDGMTAPPTLWSGVRLLCLFLTSFITTGLSGGATTWSEVQKSPDYIAAKKQIADYLPDLAIGRVQKLLALPELDANARASLLTLLGEAQVRANQPGEALKTLDDPTLREFSPAHQWRSYALTGLGRFSDAISELDKIDRPTMRPKADLQTGKLHLGLEQLTQARAKLEPLLKTEDLELTREATLQLISLSLAEKKADEAARLLATFKPKTPVEESLLRYLTGRIQLLRGERLAAVGTFQDLLNKPEIRKNLPAALLYEATLALADSLALNGNESAAAASIVETLEKYPESPKLELLFARLRQWLGKIELAPVIEKIAAFAPPLPTPPSFPMIASSSSVAHPPAALPTTSSNLRSLLALEFLATQNLRSPAPEIRLKGQLQFSLLQLLSPPDSPSVSRCLLELGDLEMKNKRPERALVLFSLLEENVKTPLIRAHAKALAGKAAFAIGKPNQASQLFLEAGEIASRARQTDLASVSALNAGITLLTTTRSKELDEITSNLDSPEARSFLILERGLYLSSKHDLAARELLTRFLSDFPNAPRNAEASLALAESAVFTPPFDQPLAQNHLAALRFDPVAQPTLEARRILVLLALGTNTQQARDFLTRHPDNPFSDRILFRLGLAYRNPARQEDKELGKANLQFELLLDKYPKSRFADAARYYSALTSVALKTESADKNALKRFRELIDGKGVLANEAAIDLCSFLIDRNRQETALQEINTFLENKNLPDSDRQRLLILAADAANQTSEHETALDYYQKLLEIKDLPIATRHRANFILGQALEKLNRPEEALEAYYDVINRKFDPAATTSLEWKWYDKCGIEGALALLEKTERWRAAITLAEKIGASGSPRSEDAREIADRLALEHFIYREQPTQEGE